MNLPKSFTDRMQVVLGKEYDAFLETFDEAYHVSLNVNTLKIDVPTFLKQFPYTLTPVPWTEDGFYYNPDDPVTKHPYFYAGLYYIQEPSAMAPVNALKPKPGDVCLDLCAAPGGKSMQISNFIEDKGLLVSNDINDTRVKAILRNAEKFGLRNVVILNESQEKIAKALHHQFNSILIDAPCSGEGMFRKDPKAVKSWERFGPEACQAMQREIIVELEHLVRQNSKIAYSTCTFSQIENEDQLSFLLDNESVFHPAQLELEGIGLDDEQRPYQTHIWPHKHKGEGHFIGVLKAQGKEDVKQEYYEPNTPPEVFQMFMDKHLSKPLIGFFSLEGDKLYLKPEIKLPLKSLRVVREGLLLGEIIKGRFTPSQALAHYLKAENFSPKIDLSSEDQDVIKYLKGETIFTTVQTEGLHLVCVDGYPLGFSKVSSGTVKNMLPSSWRMM